MESTTTKMQPYRIAFMTILVRFVRQSTIQRLLLEYVCGGLVRFYTRYSVNCGNLTRDQMYLMELHSMSSLVTHTQNTFTQIETK